MCWEKDYMELILDPCEIRTSMRKFFLMFTMRIKILVIKIRKIIYLNLVSIFSLCFCTKLFQAQHGYLYFRFMWDKVFNQKIDYFIIKSSLSTVVMCSFCENYPTHGYWAAISCMYKKYNNISSLSLNTVQSIFYYHNAGFAAL